MSQDRQLQEAVLAEFLWEPSITAAHIGVTASDGVVTLTGHVPTYYEKHAAEKAAARVKGVKAVALELEVRLAFPTERSDEDIAHAAVDRLAWEVTVPRDAIKVQVEKGWVTLTGEVAWHYQKDAAERMIRGLHGVIGVSNQTTVKPRVNTTDIGHDIGVALHRSWFDPKTINVSADGGKVKLTGTVHTPGDRWKAASTAWGSPGTTAVENDLIVVG
ncbi:BON domain-containing protein [Sphingomonas sp.]|uniref:BON domain-containing protein n=1 Tax=Sphingomonas sp. TaxID=28214 RepID=UPI0025FBD031|nr:BON domain-containing protein [Sphingomonas sp.]